MQAHELIIDAKVNTNSFGIVSPTDFQTHVGEVVNPYIILEQPNLSFYCLDHTNRQAIFVETPPETKLIEEPFYFIAQYQAAERLIAVPYETLHALAKQVTINQENVILFYSTGRCGSTLVSHALNSEPSVLSYSEPDVFSQLVMLRTSGQMADEEIITLLYDAIMLMSANATRHGYTHFSFKFRSYVLSISDLLYKAVPAAKMLFMYRNALTWARSFSRSFGPPTDEDLKNNLMQGGFRYMIPSVNSYLNANNQTISWIDYMARMWVSTMQDCRWLQAQGASLAPTRFEDLRAEPEAVIQSLFEHCGLPTPNRGQLAQVLEKDSQAGTVGAQSNQRIARALSAADLAKLEQVICGLDSTLPPSTILEG